MSRQQVLPGLPADLTRAAEKSAARQELQANRCRCLADHEEWDPCFCKCHVRPDGSNERQERQMRRDAL